MRQAVGHGGSYARVRRVLGLVGLGQVPDAKDIEIDAVFAAAGIQTLRIAPRAPKANAYAESWVRTVRTECLDWTLIWNRNHLQRVLTQYVEHYNTGRPHRGIGMQTPLPARPR